MDVLPLDIPDYSYPAYHIGIDPFDTIIKAGDTVMNDREYLYD